MLENYFFVGDVVSLDEKERAFYVEAVFREKKLFFYFLDGREVGSSEKIVVDIFGSGFDFEVSFFNVLVL